jgi:hypothetical protein
MPRAHLRLTVGGRTMRSPTDEARGELGIAAE